MVESAASGKVAVAQQKIDKSHLSARFAEKFVRVQNIKWQRRETRNEIQSKFQPALPCQVSCATLAGKVVLGKSGGEIVAPIFFRDTTGPTHRPPVFVAELVEIYGWLRMIRNLFFHKQGIP